MPPLGPAAGKDSAPPVSKQRPIQILTSTLSCSCFPAFLWSCREDDDDGDDDDDEDYFNYLNCNFFFYLRCQDASEDKTQQMSFIFFWRISKTVRETPMAFF